MTTSFPPASSGSVTRPASWGSGIAGRAESFGKQSTYRELAPVHEQVHQYAARALELASGGVGQTDSAEVEIVARMQKLELASESVLTLLDRMVEESTAADGLPGKLRA